MSGINRAMDGLSIRLGLSDSNRLPPEVITTYTEGLRLALNGTFSESMESLHSPVLTAEPETWDAGKIVADVIEEHFPAERLKRLDAERNMLGDVSRIQSMSLPETQREIYEQRHATITASQARRSHLLQAVESGYQPYSLPGSWFAGLISTDEAYDNSLTRNLDFVFQAPIPVDALEALIEANESNLFDAFVVGAPDRSLFKLRAGVLETEPIFVDPVIIGYVRVDDAAHLRSPWHEYGEDDRWLTRTTPGRQVGPGLSVEGMQGFLITHWDLSGDLEFMEQS